MPLNKKAAVNIGHCIRFNRTRDKRGLIASILKRRKHLRPSIKIPTAIVHHDNKSMERSSRVFVCVNIEYSNKRICEIPKKLVRTHLIETTTTTLLFLFSLNFWLTRPKISRSASLNAINWIYEIFQVAHEIHGTDSIIFLSLEEKREISNLSITFNFVRLQFSYWISIEIDSLFNWNVIFFFFDQLSEMTRREMPKCGCIISHSLSVSMSMVYRCWLDGLDNFYGYDILMFTIFIAPLHCECENSAHGKVYAVFFLSLLSPLLLIHGLYTV